MQKMLQLISDSQDRIERENIKLHHEVKVVSANQSKNELHDGHNDSALVCTRTSSISTDTLNDTLFINNENELRSSLHSYEVNLQMMRNRYGFILQA
jgi:hypothetical protein